MKKEIRIIQSSFPHTGCTLLLNILHGIICPLLPINWPTEEKIYNNIISKTHNTNFDQLIQKYSNSYDLYFIVSERDKKYNEKYYNYKNILIINYSKLLVSDNNSLENIINYVYSELKLFLPYDIMPKINEKIIKKNAIERIKNMNKLYEKIKDKPFSYWDKFYGLHGHHRERERKIITI